MKTLHICGEGCPGYEGMPTTSPAIINRTEFRGDDLRRFVQAGLQAMEAPAGSVRTVEFRYSPGFRTRGLCYVYEKRILLLLPRGFSGSSRRDLTELAQLYEHEIDHAKGKDHEEMPHWWDQSVTWSKRLKFRRKSGLLTRLADNYERKIRGLTLEMDKIWTPRSTPAQVLGSPRKRRTKTGTRRAR